MRSKPLNSLKAILMAATIGAASPAIAGKADDTLRLAFAQPISVVDLIFDLKPETGFTSTAVFDTLIYYDDWSHEYVPLLANTWEQVDPKTIEFKLRDDITFHDGSKFDADDVVYTINWLVHPETRFRAKDRIAWIKRAEKVDSHTVRVVAREASPTNLLRIARSVPIYPSDVHEALEDKTKFGQNPVGTGPYRAVSVDPTRGVVLEKNDDYRHGNDAKPAGKIGRIEVLPIPDVQTQVAKLMVGELDMVQGLPEEHADLLVKGERFEKTVSNSLLFSYVGFDSAGRSGVEPLMKRDVRRALLHAIDRDAILKNVVPGRESAKLMGSLCQDIETGCSYSAKPPAYDPELARRMLSEAGYPNGFSLEISTIAPTRGLAEVVANYFREVGVEATVDSLTFGAWRKKQAEDKVQAMVSMWSGGGLPDVEPSLALFFNGGSNDYWRDDEILALRKAGDSTSDVEKRKDVYTQLLDRVIEEGYIMALTTLPAVFVHTTEVNIRSGSLSPFGAQANHISWK